MLLKVMRALPLSLLLGLLAVKVYAQDEGGISTDELAYAIDNMFLLICAVLVLFMQAGFAMVEAGFNSAKNAVNIMFKNLIDLCAGVLLFWFIGYSLMYGSSGSFPAGWPSAALASAMSRRKRWPATCNPQVDWLFQVAFAATAATIVSGAVAGRMKFGGYLIYSIFITGLIYPISGYWKWGGGWLDAMGFYDFAGSLVVHAVGGFAGSGRRHCSGPAHRPFLEKGNATHAPPQLALATLGVFILWVGWYGFNPGSQLAFAGAATPTSRAHRCQYDVGGGSRHSPRHDCRLDSCQGKPDLGFALNGALAGLVGITANCDSGHQYRSHCSLALWRVSWSCSAWSCWNA